MTDAPDRYEQAAKIILNDTEAWRRVRDELGLSDSSMKRLRVKLKAEIYRALKIMQIVRSV